jgi:hypothetical protein
MTRARTQNGRRPRLGSPRWLRRKPAQARNLIEVTVFPEPNGEVVELGPEEPMEYAWAAHQRVFAPGKGSFLRTLTGCAVGAARALLEERRLARATREREDFLEALQWCGRVIAEVFVPNARRLTGKSDHDCDCTCAGEEGHAQWTVGPPAWQSADIGPLLLRLASGERVRVRLEVSGDATQRGSATAPLGAG